MKRHPSLHPLSRDHHEGLLLCWTIQESLQISSKNRSGMDARAAFALFEKEWRGWLPAHFTEEELWVPRLLHEEGLSARLREEHAAIRALAVRLMAMDSDSFDAQLLAEFAVALHDHIRWEERELFPAIERMASPATLEELGKAMNIMEAARPRSCNLPSSSPRKEKNEE